MSRILFDRFDDGVIILGIDDTDLGNTQSQNLLDCCFREGLKGACYGDFPVAHILDQNSSVKLFLFDLLGQIELFDIIENLDDVAVATEADRASKRSGQEFAAAFPAI